MSERMKGNLKVAVAFIAGGILMNAGFAVSNSASTQDLLSEALASALNQVNEREAEREDRELAKLPNILDCQNMQWMQNCTEINKQAKKNPNAPIRMTNQSGLEFNFQPGTPSPMIRLQLEQTPDAAAAAVKYMDSTWGEYKKSASLYQVAMWQSTDIKHLNGLDGAQKEQKEVKPLDLKNLSLSVFIESTCAVCDRYLIALDALQQRYPQLVIRIFQIDADKEAFMRKVSSRGLRGRVLSREESIQVQRQGVRSWPISWVDHVATKKRETVVGNRSLNQIETRLLAMTYAAAKTNVLAKAGK